MHENTFNSLIEAGWNVIHTDFDTVAIANWRRKALHFVSELMGPDHPDTDYFKSFVHGGSERGSLARAGILNATKEKLNSQGQYCSIEHRD